MKCSGYLSAVMRSALALLAVSLPTGTALAESDDVVIAITDFQGPDPYMVPVTESLLSWFSDIAAEDSSFSVFRHEGTLPRDGTFEEVYGDFIDHGADLVLYGQYDLPGTRARLVLSAACLTGTVEGQRLHIHLDREGTFPLTELVPGSDPPDRIRFVANALVAMVHISEDSIDEGLVHLERALALEGSVPEEITAFAYSIRSLVDLKREEAVTALEYANTSIELCPDWYLAYLYRGNAYEILGDLESALENYLLVEELEPQIPENLYNMSRMYRDLGDTEKAMESINCAIELAPREPAYINTRGYLHNYLGDYEAAVEDISAALAIDPEYPTGWANLGCAQRELGLLEDAVESFTLALEYQEDPFLRGSYLRDRGGCYALLEDYSRGIEDYRAGMSLAGATAAGHAYLGWMLMQNGGYDEALQSYDNALAMDPGNPHYLSRRGKCNYMNRDLQAAIEDYTLAQTLDPEGFDGYEYLGKSLSESGDQAAAIQCFTQGAEGSDDPEERAWLISYRAVCNRLAGKIDEVLMDYREASELQPDEPYFHFRLGETLWLMDREPEAVMCYDTAIEKGLEQVYMPGCLLQRGRSYIVLEDIDRAIADFDRALEIRPDFAEVYYFRGKAHYMRDEIDECVRDMEHYLEIGDDTELLIYASIFLRELRE